MQKSHWLILGVIAVLLVLLLVKRLRQVPAGTARELVAAGALVLDVRSSQEFADRHIEGAVNLPVEQIARRMESIEPDRSRPLLVHCQSGTRSAIACRILRGLGYRQVHDLGSFGRARALAGR